MVKYYDTSLEYTSLKGLLDGLQGYLAANQPRLTFECTRKMPLGNLTKPPNNSSHHRRTDMETLSCDALRRRSPTMSSADYFLQVMQVRVMRSETLYHLLPRIKAGLTTDRPKKKTKPYVRISSDYGT